MQHKVSVGDLEFRYRQIGESGPIIILLHGFGGGPADWEIMGAELSKDHRVLIPNISPLFASREPISFSDQIVILRELVEKMNPMNEKIHLVGSSYGGTLTWGLSRGLETTVASQTLVNPMPLYPLSVLRHPHVRILFWLLRIPGALRLFVMSHFGRKVLFKLGQLFRMGIVGNKKFMHLNHRKLFLIEKAIQRFYWIISNESWQKWEADSWRSMIPTFIIAGGKDRLFHPKDYRKFSDLAISSVFRIIEGASHLAVKSHGEEISNRTRELIDLIEDRKPEEPAPDALILEPA